MNTVGSQLFRPLSPKKHSGIENCLKQFCNNTREERTKLDFYGILVCFPQDANNMFNSNTPKNGYYIRTKKEENFVSSNILEHAKKIWTAGFIPVEVTHDGISSFFAAIETTERVLIMPSEDEIPSVAVISGQGKNNGANITL